MCVCVCMCVTGTGALIAGLPAQQVRTPRTQTSGTDPSSSLAGPLLFGLYFRLPHWRIRLPAAFRLRMVRSSAYALAMANRLPGSTFGGPRGFGGNKLSTTLLQWQLRTQSSATPSAAIATRSAQ